MGGWGGRINNLGGEWEASGVILQRGKSSMGCFSGCKRQGKYVLGSMPRGEGKRGGGDVQEGRGIFTKHFSILYAKYI